MVCPKEILCRHFAITKVQEKKEGPKLKGRDHILICINDGNLWSKNDVIERKKFAFKEGFLQVSAERTVLMTLVIREFLFLKLCA